MTKEQIKQTIIEQILEIAPDVEENEIVSDKNIQRSLEIDSFDFLKILTALNDVLGIAVPEADYGQVDTLDHMIAYFAKRIAS
ncbi:MAG TPA: phosphopantetheine-binding protein [Sulfurovum sp. UBA12169]|nr:MAG TPA: phosphopantetheine-binding protein [Sulfurovum sp. UBA12169]